MHSSGAASYTLGTGVCVDVYRGSRRLGVCYSSMPASSLLLLFSDKRGLLTFVHNNLLGSAQLEALCHGEFLNPGNFKKLFITEFHPLKASLLLVHRVV